MKNILYYLFGVLLLAGCKEDEYELSIPMSGIYLSLPLEGSALDLNDASLESYSFSWEKPLEEGSVLIFSTNRNLVDPVVMIEGGTVDCSMTALEVDQYFSRLNIKAGKDFVLYWAVKEKGHLSKAASEVRTIHAKRMTSKLLQPEDLTNVNLSFDDPEITVLFKWDTNNQPENTKYSVCFSLDPELKDRVKIGVGNIGQSYISHEKLQEAMVQLAIKRYKANTIYWNVETEDGSLLSRSSGVLEMKDMMKFDDIRGDEKNTYHVARINFKDGTSQVWLADNLRALKYADGTDIESDKVKQTPASFGEGKSKAYGNHYHFDIRNNIAPVGWRLPTKAEYEKLYNEAAMAEGQWNVLKDTEYYESVKGQPHLNDWGLRLCSSGQWVGEAIINHTGPYCYLLAADEEGNACVLHDGGATLWHSWTTGAPARFIYNE